MGNAVRGQNGGAPRRRRHALALGGAAVALAALLGVTAGRSLASSAGTTAGTADQTYTDATGDARGGRLDITRVRLSSTNDRLDIRFTTREKTINVGEHLFINVDTDGDDNREWVFAFRGGGSGSIGYLKFPTSAGTLQNAPASLATACCQDFGVTLMINLAAIGNPARIRFNTGSKEADESTTWDWAPDSGRWEFVMRQTPPPTTTTKQPPARDFQVRDSWMRPNAPQAGKRVVAGAQFVYNGTRQAVRGGTVTCRGRLGSRGLSGRPGHSGGTGTCSFRLPADAAGKTLRTRVTLSTQQYEAWTELTRTVVGGARQLALSEPNVFPNPPRAGSQLQAAVRVELRQTGAGSRRVDVARRNVTCSGAVAGRAIRGAAVPRPGEGVVCTWNIPASARGATFRGRIVVRVAGQTATKSFSGVVR